MDNTLVLDACGHVCFFNDTATTEIYTLSLHDALPIFLSQPENMALLTYGSPNGTLLPTTEALLDSPELVEKKPRSEEHTSELQSRQYLVCRLLLEKKKNRNQHLQPTSQDHRPHHLPNP